MTLLSDKLVCDSNTIARPATKTVPFGSCSVVIFSSFHKFLDEISQAHRIFTDYGILVSSPPSLTPIDPSADYVRFPEDNPILQDHEIQDRVFAKAARADAIYVICKEGYVGKTVSYEIGWAVAHNKPLYFSELPQETFMRAHAIKRIVDPHELSGIIIQSSAGQKDNDSR